jgi:resolvase-like protein
MSFSIVVALAALGLAGVAALALRRPHELALGNAQPHRGRRRPAEPATLCAPWRSWLGPRRARSSTPPAEGEPAPAQPAEPARVAVIGYATFSDRAGAESDDELARQAGVIARACDRRGLVLLEMVGDPDHDRGPLRPKLSDARPGLRYALERIAAGDAQGLVVPGLRRLTRSVAELGPIIDWCARREARLVAVAQGLDTSERESRIAARLIIEVSRWERERLSESLGEGQSPSHQWATSAVVDDDPELLSRSGGESS